MKVGISAWESEWDGWPAVTMESEVLRAVAIPQLGAKIVSLYDKAREVEWMTAPARPLRQPTYGDSFVDYDLSGWDEVIPTNAPCAYPVQGSFAGRYLPDHGELWPVNWNYSIEDGAVEFGVDGKALPYHLKRVMHFNSPSSLRLEYTLRNHVDEPLSYLWAAHNLFAADENTRVVLPSRVTMLYNVVAGGAWGGAGQLHKWPVAKRLDGAETRLDSISSDSDGAFRRFYVPPEVKIDSAALLQESSEDWVRLRWNSGHVPYFALWVDARAFSKDWTIGLSPSTAFYDNLVTAVDNSRVSILPPSGTNRWDLTVDVGRGVRALGG